MKSRNTLMYISCFSFLLTGYIVWDAGYTDNVPVERYEIDVGERIPITYSVSLKMERSDIIAAPDWKSLKDKIGKALKDSGLFSEVTYTQADDRTSYHIAFDFKQCGMSESDSVAVGLLAGYTLLLVPTGEVFTFDSTARLSLQGAPIYSTGKPEEIRCLIWLPMAPAGIFMNSWTAWHFLENGSINSMINDIVRFHRKRFRGIRQSTDSAIVKRSVSRARQTSGVIGNQFVLDGLFNIPFNTNVLEQVGAIGVLPEDSSAEHIKRYDLGMLSEKFHVDFPGSKRFFGFRPYMLFVSDTTGQVVGIYTAREKTITGRDKMNLQASEIRHVIEMSVGSETVPVHTGTSKLHRWRWEVLDHLGRSVKIILAAKRFNDVSDTWGMYLGVFVSTDEAVLEDGMGQENKTARSCTGTGWFVTSNTVVTCNHVVNGAQRVSVKTKDGQDYEAIVLALNKEHDIAILKVKSFVSSSTLPIQTHLEKMSSKVFTLGYPFASILGNDQKYSEGVISAMTGIDGDKTRYQISTPVQPGNSGGALVNEHGFVVGMIDSTLSTKYIAREKGTIPQNINYAVKSRHIVAALEDSDIDFEATNLSYDNHNNYQKLVDKASAATVLVFTE